MLLQGGENAKQFLRDNSDIRNKLEAEVRKAVGMSVPAELAAPPAEPAVSKAKK